MAKKKRPTRDLWELPERSLPQQAALIARVAARLIKQQGGETQEMFARAVACLALANATTENLKGLEPDAVDKLLEQRGRVRSESPRERLERALYVAYALGFEYRGLVTARSKKRFVATGAAGERAPPKSPDEKNKAAARVRLRRRMRKLIAERGWNCERLLDEFEKDYGPYSSKNHTWERGTMRNMLIDVHAEMRRQRAAS